MTLKLIIVLIPAVALTLLLLIGAVDAINLRRIHPTASLPTVGFYGGIMLAGVLYALAFAQGGL